MMHHLENRVRPSESGPELMSNFKIRRRSFSISVILLARVVFVPDSVPVDVEVPALGTLWSAGLVSVVVRNGPAVIELLLPKRYFFNASVESSTVSGSFK